MTKPKLDNMAKPERNAVRLRDGSTTTDRRLDLVREPDARNASYRVADVLTERQLQRPRSYTWRVERVLDQKSQGACVGFAWAHELLARPAVIHDPIIDHRFAVENIYWAAQRHDRYPGGAYPDAMPIMAGTSVLAAAKVIHAFGYMREYRWAYTLEEVVAAIAFKGPVVLGGGWFEGMQRPDENAFVAPTGSWRGGHCVLLTGVRVRWDARGEAPDPYASTCTLLNSWGPRWGNQGRAHIRWTELGMLITRGKADVCVPIARTSRLGC